MFTKILFVLVGLLSAYYVVTIIIDLTKPSADGQQSDKDEEEIEIDEKISDFESTEVSRTKPQTQKTDSTNDNPETETNSADTSATETTEETTSNGSKADQYQLEDSEDSHKGEKSEYDVDYMLETVGRIPDEILQSEDSEGSSRRPIMTDGMDVQNFVANVEMLAQKGNSELGDVIFECRQAA